MPGPQMPATVPQYYTQQLKNGLKIIGTKDSEAPKIVILLTINDGDLVFSADPKKVGLAELTANMMEEGTQNYTTEQVSAELEKLGSTISFNASMENTTVTVNALAKNLDATLKLLEEKLYRPKFDAEDFKRVGADILSIHIDACSNLHRNLQQIKELGMKAGVAVNPHTPVNFLQDILHELDVVNLMSVNPGFGGQKFIPYTLEKIKQLRRMIDEKGLNVLIEIDGGVTEENAKQILDAGADVLVAGSTIFNSPDPIAMIAKLKAL